MRRLFRGENASQPHTAAQHAIGRPRRGRQLLASAAGRLSHEAGAGAGGSYRGAGFRRRIRLQRARGPCRARAARSLLCRGALALGRPEPDETPVDATRIPSSAQASLRTLPSGRFLMSRKTRSSLAADLKRGFGFPIRPRARERVDPRLHGAEGAPPLAGRSARYDPKAGPGHTRHAPYRGGVERGDGFW
jgi:hypothetical protein